MIASIHLEDSIVEDSRQFALDRIGLSEELYRQRGEARKSKMIDDITVGTMAEWACWEHLLKDAPGSVSVTPPDTQIYTGRQKSFSADLVYTSVTEEINFHVKSQTYKSAAAYGSSWLCQKSDRLFKEPGPNDYMIFCLVEDNRVDIKAIVAVQDLVERDLLGEPKVWRYQSTKIALYLDDILEADIDTECF